jgi:hypothetical protein
MAKTVLKNCMVIVNGTDISNQVSDITIETSRPEVDVTAMQDVNTETLAGIGDATITATVFNDYAAGALDSIFFPLSQSNTPFVVEIRPNNAARSTSNPAYLMTAILFNYSPIAGGVGAAATTTLTFRNAAQAGLTRATA